MVDPDNAVVKLCAAGMAVDGDAAAASTLFQLAWEAARNDYEASIAAHFLARHQPGPVDSLKWNRLAVEHAEAVGDERARPFLASLYLNLGESFLALGYSADAATAADRGIAALRFLPSDCYREFVSRGLNRLVERIAEVNPRRADI